MGTWFALMPLVPRPQAYNIGNKLVLTAFPMPWTAATWELFFGFPYVFFLWTTGLRKAPKLSMESIKLLAPSGVLLAGTHVGGVISFGLGAISFTHVLKATEPVWSALISAVIFRDFLPVSRPPATPRPPRRSAARSRLGRLRDAPPQRGGTRRD